MKIIIQLSEEVIYFMLNHKFYFEGAEKEEEGCYIRISNPFMETIQRDLNHCRFIWNGCEELQYGLGPDITIIRPDELNQIKECLLNQEVCTDESEKLMKFVDRAMSEKKQVIHENGSPGSMVHDFVICSEFPETIAYTDYRDKFVKIQDQFILDNYDVFEKVELYWGNTQTVERGFNYYGVTLLSTQMAQQLKDAMSDFLEHNTSEKAAYFAGEEYDTLTALLDKAIKENKGIIHFGI